MSPDELLNSLAALADAPWDEIDHQRGLHRLREGSRRLREDPREARRLDEIVRAVEVDYIVYRLGAMAESLGVLGRAEECFRAAANADHDDAAFRLAGVLERQADELERDIKGSAASAKLTEAEQWYRRAHAAGVVSAGEALAQLNRRRNRLLEAAYWREQATAFVGGAARMGSSSTAVAASPSGRADAERSESDRELLALHVGGDGDAFGEIVRRHCERLWAVALRMLGDPEEAADAVQDVLESAFRSAGSFRGDAAVTTWLHRIVVNACLDRVRRRAVRQTVPLPDDEAAPADSRDPVEKGMLRAALRTLPTELRSVLILVDMQGYSVEEAARILDVPPGTVKSRRARARAKFLSRVADLRSQSAPPHRDPARGGARDAPPLTSPGHGRVATPNVRAAGPGHPAAGPADMRLAREEGSETG